MPIFKRSNQETAQRRVIVLFVSDTHAGNALGLMNPAVTLYQQSATGELTPYSPPISPLQKQLWPWFTDDIKAVSELAGADEIIYIHQGDVVQGNKHRVLIIENGHQVNQGLIAIANQQPILSLPNVKQARFIAGTAAHDGIGAEAVVGIVSQLKTLYPKVSFKILYHGVLNIDGCRIDYAHHGPGPGNRKWLEGNPLVWYLRDIVLKEWTGYTRIAPRLLTRAHQHTYRHVPYCATLNGQEYQFDAILLPSWCGVQDFDRKVTKSAMAQQFGMVAAEIIGGELVQIHTYLHDLDLRMEETL